MTQSRSEEKKDSKLTHDIRGHLQSVASHLEVIFNALFRRLNAIGTHMDPTPENRDRLYFLINTLYRISNSQTAEEAELMRESFDVVISQITMPDLDLFKVDLLSDEVDDLFIAFQGYLSNPNDPNKSYEENIKRVIACVNSARLQQLKAEDENQASHQIVYGQVATFGQSFLARIRELEAKLAAITDPEKRIEVAQELILLLKSHKANYDAISTLKQNAQREFLKSDSFYAHELKFEDTRIEKFLPKQASQLLKNALAVRDLKRNSMHFNEAIRQVIYMGVTTCLISFPFPGPWTAIGWGTWLFQMSLDAVPKDLAESIAPQPTMRQRVTHFATSTIDGLKNNKAAIGFVGLGVAVSLLFFPVAVVLALSCAAMVILGLIKGMKSIIDKGLVQRERTKEINKRLEEHGTELDTLRLGKSVSLHTDVVKQTKQMNMATAHKREVNPKEVKREEDKSLPFSPSFFRSVFQGRKAKPTALPTPAVSPAVSPQVDVARAQMRVGGSRW